MNRITKAIFTTHQYAIGYNYLCMGILYSRFNVNDVSSSKHQFPILSSNTYVLASIKFANPKIM